MVNHTRSCFFTIKLSIPWTSHLTDTHPLERTRSLCRFFFSFRFWFLDNFEVCSVDSVNCDPVSRRACSSQPLALDWCNVSCSALRSCETETDENDDNFCYFTCLIAVFQLNDHRFVLASDADALLGSSRNLLPNIAWRGGQRVCVG